jgi:hypothetical protein
MFKIRVGNDFYIYIVLARNVFFVWNGVRMTATLKWPMLGTEHLGTSRFLCKVLSKSV